MKTIALILALVFSPIVSAEMPEYLKGGTVTVTLKDGTQYTFSSDEYMVARRDQANDRVVAAYAQGARTGAVAGAAAVKEVMEAEAAKANKKWRASVMGGVGSDGLDTKMTSNSVEVTERQQFVYGFGLSYKVHGDVSVGGQLLSNKTYTLGVGLDF